MYSGVSNWEMGTVLPFLSAESMCIYPKLCRVQNFTPVPFDGGGGAGGDDEGGDMDDERPYLRRRGTNSASIYSFEKSSLILNFLIYEMG